MSRIIDALAKVEDVLVRTDFQEVKSETEGGEKHADDGPTYA